MGRYQKSVTQNLSTFAFGLHPRQISPNFSLGNLCWFSVQFTFKPVDVIKEMTFQPLDRRLALIDGFYNNCALTCNRIDPHFLTVRGKSPQHCGKGTVINLAAVYLLRPATQFPSWHWILTVEQSPRLLTYCSLDRSITSSAISSLWRPKTSS